MTRSSSDARLVLLAAALLGCGGGGGAADGGDGGEDAGADTDADAGGDTDTGTDTGEAPAWPPYGPLPSWTSTDPGYATGAAFADIDGDGAEDLIVANGNDMLPGPILVYRAAGGALPTAATWSSAESAYHGHLDVGDVNGDGRPDVVAAVYLGAAGFDEPGGVVYYENEGGELPAVPTWRASAAFYCFSVALGDVDGDGDLDLAAATGDSYYHDPEPDLLFRNDGGAFAEPAAWTSAVPRHSMDVEFLDANADGRADLAFASIGGPHAVYLGDAATGLPATAPSVELPGSAFEGNTLAAGDLNGDGAVDLVISDNNQQGGPGTVRAFCGPSFAECWESADPPTYQSAVALADLDGDGDLDLAAGSWWGPIRFYRNGLAEGGEAPFEELPSAATATETVVEAIVFHDVNGDGAVDLLATDWTYEHGNDLYLHL